MKRKGTHDWNRPRAIGTIRGDFQSRGGANRPAQLKAGPRDWANLGKFDGFGSATAVRSKGCVRDGLASSALSRPDTE
jgi:hypothetical protein